jgi:hypothetical protein
MIAENSMGASSVITELAHIRRANAIMESVAWNSTGDGTEIVHRGTLVSGAARPSRIEVPRNLRDCLREFHPQTRNWFENLFHK